MYQKLLISVLIVLINSSAWSADKSKFDISISEDIMSLQKSAGIGYEGLAIKNQVSEMTLLQGGYFTLGTNHGLSAGNLDDHCGITFGHPYALTSYPVVSIDGVWGQLDSFWDIYSATPQMQGDSLVLRYLNSGAIQITFSVKPDPSGQKITITTSMKNVDTQPHVVAMGMVFDPALGKKGDGWANIGNQDILQDTMLIGASIPAQVMIKERIGKVDGMKLLVDFRSFLPNKLIFANWKDVYQNHGSQFSVSELRGLYDLTMKIIWAEQTIPAGDEASRSVAFNLQPPDFSSSLFMRWDLPGFLSLENNLLFPRYLDSFVEIANQTSTSQSNLTLKLQLPDELSSSSTNYEITIPGSDMIFKSVKLQSKEILEDKIVDLSATIEQNGQLLDHIKRSVYIPAIPLSDTGLVCTIDTVLTSDYPRMKFIFQAQVEKTGQKLFNLQSENVFLYENNTRIKGFTMGKDTTGGVTMADIVFVLDVTGSMSDEINHVKSTIIEFCDSLKARGIDFRLGMVCFLDIIENVYDFTSDPQLFKSYVSAQSAHGGGDGPENSLDALYRAAQFPFRDASKRIFIWITDSNYHEKDWATTRTKQEVIDQLLLKDVTVHSIGAVGYQTAFYNPIIEPTGGSFYNIYGNFRDILLDISRIKSTSRYLVTYQSPGAISGSNQIMIEIHYAGLGGTTVAEYKHGAMRKPAPDALACYPNPFNPTIQITVNLEEQSTGTVEIYNILGQRIRSYSLRSPESKHFILWDARDAFNREVSMGTYFVRLNIFGTDGKATKTETTKILYLR